MGRFVTLFYLSLLPLLHPPVTMGLLLPITSPIYLDIPLFLGMEHSAESCTCVFYTIHLALSVAWHHVGFIWDSASGRKGSHLRIANRTFT